MYLKIHAFLKRYMGILLLLHSSFIFRLFIILQRILKKPLFEHIFISLDYS